MEINFMKGNYNFNNFYLIKDYGLVMIRLDLVKEKVYNDNNERFIKWLKLINTESLEEMRKIAKGDEVMEQALEFMEEFLNDEEIRNVYDKINDVKYYAKKEEKVETAKNMLKKGFPLQEISEITNLSIKEINDLKK